MKNPDIARLKKMATPTRLGVTIGPEYLGAPYVPYPWILEVEKRVLEAINDPKERFLILNVPPQNGKTTTFGMLLSAWYLGMNPHNQVIFVAYNEEYAATWGMKTRNLLARYGRDLFGESVSNQQDSKSNWKMSNGFGGMLSAGIGGGITGNPGHLIICLTGDAVVETSTGPVRLDDLARCKYDDLHVLSFDHVAQRSVYSPVAVQRSTRRSDIVEIATVEGRSIRCTSDHPVYVEGLGYRNANLLRPGWRVRCLPGVWYGHLEEGRDEVVPPMLAGRAQDKSRVRLRGLREARFRIAGKSSKTAPTDLRPRLYHSSDDSRDGVDSALPVRQASEVAAGVLLAEVSVRDGRHQSAPGRQTLPAVRGEVQAADIEAGLLLARMCRPGSLAEDARDGQLPLQNRNELHVRLPERQTSRHGARWWSLRRLRDEQPPPPRPSRGSRPTEQRSRQSGDALRYPPRDTSQVGHDTISMVREIRAGEVDVYDLTVPATRNFFANGILVHNCDDVIKTMEDASSASTKQKHLDEYDGSISSRFQEGTTVIITATRFAEDDLSGALIDRQNQPGYTGNRFEVISIPAIAEPPEELELEPEELKAWRDFLGRRAGEGLKGRYSQQFYERRKESLNAGFVWSALYQQTPSVREGGMFPKSNWAFWSLKNEGLPSCTRFVRVWDLATTEGGGDYTVGAKFGLGEDGHIYLIERERGRWGTGEVERRVESVAKRDGYSCKIMIEQEKAGAGKAVVEHYQRLLRGHVVEAAKIEGSKEVRATPYSAMQQNSQVHLPADDERLCKEWITEHKQMMGDGRRPRHDDQVDTGAYAVLELLGQGSTEMWIPGEDTGSLQLEQSAMRMIMGESIFSVQ